MSTPLKSIELLGRLFKFSVDEPRPARPDHIPTLWRVEMWCGRNWIEARERSLVALAANDLKTYRAARQDELDWFGALLVVNRLALESSGGNHVPKT